MGQVFDMADRPSAHHFNRWERAADAAEHDIGLTFRISTTALTDNKTGILTNALIPNGTGTPSDPRYKVGELVLDLTTKKYYRIKSVEKDGKANLGTSVGTLA